MKSLIRCSAGVAIGLLLLAGVMSVRGSWLSTMGLDFRSIEESFKRIEAQRERAEKLSARGQQILGRCQEKATLARELVEGKKTLAEAISRMRDICNAEPSCWKWLRRAEPGNTDEERLGTHLLGWISTAFPDNPARAEEAVARFREELSKEHKPTRTLRS